MAITQKHNNRYHGLQSELPFKLPTNSLYYCTDSKNVYIYNINEDPELLFDSSTNPALYPLPVDLPIVGGTSDIDPITLMLSTDSGNITSLGSDGGLMVDETTTSISEDNLGNQSYINEDSILFNINTYQLPAPVWESKALRQGVILSDGTYVYGDQYFARIPLVDQKLIDEGILFVEYGRLKSTGQGKKRPGQLKARGTKISFYSPRYGQNAVSGRGYSAGHHNSSIDRPNMFKVIHQGFNAEILPRNSFYVMKDCSFFNGAGAFSYSIPRITGSRTKKIRNVPSMIANGVGPINGQLRDLVNSSSERYARLVVIKNNKVIKQGPISEPLSIEWKLPVYWNEFERVYSIENVSGTPIAKFTIGHKYKQ